MTRKSHYGLCRISLTNNRPDLYVPGGLTTNLTPAHRASIVDGVVTYISWAISAGFGVVDVNVPESITRVDSDTLALYSSAETDAARVEGEKLISYLYTNYIEPSEATSIIMMGVGNAFHAVAKLLSESEDLYKHLSGVVGFISTNPVRPVRSPWVQGWYRMNSLVYVAETHQVWQKSKEGKVSRVYGNIQKSEGNAANDIMIINRDAVQNWMLEKVRDDDETEDESDSVEGSKPLESPGPGSNPAMTDRHMAQAKTNDEAVSWDGRYI